MEPAVRWTRKAAQPGLSALQKAAYGQLARVQSCRFTPTDQHGSFNILASPGENPLAKLHRMGIGIVPILVEALDDTSPSQTVTPGRGEAPTVWQVNQLVARLIEQVCEHTFVIGEPEHEQMLWEIGGHPELVAPFQKVILDWFNANHQRQPAERKIADLSDRWFWNRLDALSWLGKRKVTDAVPAITANLKRALAAPLKDNDAVQESEVAASVIALGQLGDKTAAPVVRQATQRVFENVARNSFATISPQDFQGCYDTLVAFCGREAALSCLASLYAQHHSTMPREYIDLLNWSVEQLKKESSTRPASGQ